ncbi:hypothetical protein OEOE_1722 [Oenococcus oeni PSU-1]|uniref:Uncharacterized protein n=1 Tax=Oenococcus oeni (strain ATCC BAA-331 / PSU-1) TaxID=203123 RepID=Q04DA5_OENOB|nr:hypothetical protein OEOE_1722 [Oenococcus oeni PSU-1]
MNKFINISMNNFSYMISLKALLL